MKKLILISTLFITPLVFSQDYVYNGINEINAKVGLKDKNNEPEKLSQWTFTNINLAGFYPSWTDGSSSGYLYIKFNMGQENFLGDPKGYQAYDESFNINLLVGVNNQDDGFFKVSSNLSNSYYNKSYNSGKYYYEIYIKGNNVSDYTGFSEGSLQNMKRQKAYGISYIGGFDKKIYKLIDSSIRNIVYTLNNISADEGSVIQVWVDFNNGNLLIKELGTPISEYNTVSSE